jgi:hypothetical protein
LLGVSEDKPIRATTTDETIEISQGDRTIHLTLDYETGRSIEISTIGVIEDIHIPESEFGNIDLIIEALRIAKKKLGL